MPESQPTIARRSMGRALERHREANGLTRAEAGRAIGYSGQTVQRIEEGTQATRPLVVEKLCGLYDISAREMSHLTTLALRGKERGWWETYFDVGTGQGSRPAIPLFLETEQIAVRARYLETEVIPGPLQTKDFLRELQSAQLPMPEDVAESWRELRTHRQTLLYGRKTPPQLEFLIGRAAIDYLEEMPREVREEQLARLVNISATPTADVRIITSIHAATAGAFSILDPVDDADPFVFMDAADGCRYIEEPLLVSMYEQIFDAARGRSTSIEEYLG